MPAALRYKGRPLQGLAFGSRIVWRAATDSYTISVGINPTNVSHVSRIEASGDVIDTQVSATKDTYKFIVSSESKASIRIIPAEGYAVEKLNVDTVSQGAKDTYTFDKVTADHTMYVWMKVAELPEEKPVDFLQRSDNDRVYSSLHLCLKDVKTDYPDGLTKDISITCIKKATEKRDPQDPGKLTNERLFISVLKDWNKRSLYSLTIEGNGLYTINGNSLGGMRFESVDNVIIKNINFVDFANYAKYGSPEEMSAITFIGKDSDFANNLYINNCSFDGIYNASGSYYTIITKLTTSVYILNSIFKNNSGLIFKLTDTKLISLIKNNISGKQRYGVVSHPGFFSNSSTLALYIEDNRMNGATFDENLFYINNTQNVYIRRNEFYGSVGRILELASNNQVDNFIFETNLLRDNLYTPIFPWIMDLLSLVSDIDNCEFRSNTVYFNGSLYRQWFARASANYCNKLLNCNNIFIEATSGDVVNSVYAFKGVKQYTAFANLYKAKLREEEQKEQEGQEELTPRFYNLQIMISANEESNTDYLAISGNDARNLSYYIEKGYEAGSFALAKSIKVLNIESGGSTYGLIASIANTYVANTSHLPEFDLNYKQNVYLSSIGAINHNGVNWDENTDNTVGYKGLNTIVKTVFSEESEYTVPADDTILISSKSKNRGLFIKVYLKSSIESYLCLGKNTLFNPVCRLKGDGTYNDMQIYNVEIEKE